MVTRNLSAVRSCGIRIPNAWTTVRYATCAALTSVLISYGSISAATQAPAPALSYFFEDVGDIIMNSVLVPGAPTVSTYYETLGWNFNYEGGGYTGIQWTTENYSASGGPVFIFSLWDPISISGPINAVYTDAGTQTRRFGGEGTGLNSMNWTLGWVPDQWYTTLVRRWDCAGHTCFGHWVQKKSTGVWTHNITMDYPVPNVQFIGSSAFLEDWASNGLTRSMYLRDFWVRQSDKSWMGGNQPFFTVGQSASTLPGAYDARTVGDTFYMQSGANTVATLPPKTSLPAIVMPAAPTLTIGAVTQLTTTPVSGSNAAALNWTIDPTRSPQFAYRVVMRSLVDGTTVSDQETVIPHARAANVAIPGPSQFELSLQIRDIFDQLSAPRVSVVGTPANPAGLGNTLQFSANAYTVNEGDAMVSIQVTRVGNTLAPASVDFTTMAGSAAVGSDFTFTSGTLSWGAGDSYSKLITVPIINDGVAESVETFTLNLSNPVGATLGTTTLATVSIVDDDSALVDMPTGGTIVSNPYGPMTIQGGQINAQAVSFTSNSAVIQLGSNSAPPGAVTRLDFQSLNIGPGNTLTLRSGAPGQSIVIVNLGLTPAAIRGVLRTEGGNGAEDPSVYVASANGITVLPGGRMSALSGLSLDTLDGTRISGQPLINDGILDGGSDLHLFVAKVTGGGQFKGNAVGISTSGNANNPANGAHFLANGLQIYPHIGTDVALKLNGYGPQPQVFNLTVNGNASVSMPSLWPAGSHDFPNNLPVLPGATRLASEPPPAYGGGSMILQASATITLDGGISNDFVFPGGIAMRSGGRMDLKGVAVNNGWTTEGKPFSGQYFESPDIVGDPAGIKVYTNDLNWVNFSTYPHVPVQAFTLIEPAGEDARFANADMVAPHINLYSTLSEAAAAGMCWRCLTNMYPVTMR